MNPNSSKLCTGAREVSNCVFDSKLLMQRCLGLALGQETRSHMSQVKTGTAK